MAIGSRINKTFTLEYMTTVPENKYFDRKSAAIKPSDLAKHITKKSDAKKLRSNCEVIAKFCEVDVLSRMFYGEKPPKKIAK